MLGPVVVDLVGFSLSPAEVDLIQHPHVGGIILFGRNFSNPAQIIDLIASVRSVRSELLISIDQEGGRVQRLREGFTRLPPLQALGLCYQRDPALASKIIPSLAWLMAVELLAIGVDLSFAPVLDADESFSSVIGDRSFGVDVDLVIAAAELYLQGMAAAGMRATAKHFPGHGAVRVDSHHALPIDDRGFDQVWASDMRPFRALLPQYDAVMPAHILFSNIDSKPVGCSAFWLQQILRQQLGFQGVIFSDDLSMAGAEFAGGYGDRALAALRAGCDAVLVCNQPERAKEVLATLVSEGWPCNDALAQMRPNLSVPFLSLSQLRTNSRWLEAQEFLILLDTITTR